jgi:hypothetical protein
MGIAVAVLMLIVAGVLAYVGLQRRDYFSLYMDERIQAYEKRLGDALKDAASTTKRV